MKQVAVDHLRLMNKFLTGYYFPYGSGTYNFKVRDPEFLTVYIHDEDQIQRAINTGANELCVGDFSLARKVRDKGWTSRLMFNGHYKDDPIYVAAHDVEFTGICLGEWTHHIIAEYAELGFDIHIDSVESVQEVLDLAALPIRGISTIFPLKAAAGGVILHPDPEVAAYQSWPEENLVEWCEYFPGVARKNLETVKSWLNGKEGEIPVWL